MTDRIPVVMLDPEALADGQYVLMVADGKLSATPSSGSGGGGGTLAAVVHNPVTEVVDAFTTSDADIDSTNLTATITVPASGVIVAVFTCTVIATAPTSSGSTAVYLTFRSGGATIAKTKRRALLIPANAPSQQAVMTHRAVISGLTPEASYTIRPGGYVILGTGGSPSASLIYGDDGGADPFGPAVFTVESV